ncbi:UNVERIFIED_ORG: SAM-dependent MidA family methyltransferase [Martelella mediterranea]
MTTPLGKKIKTMIETGGPMPVSTYFTLCLADPEYGYYLNRDPLGRSGDFTTAPEVSQLFGELVGIFLIQVWQSHGRPEKTVLIEGGPGRGTMMADILNVIAQLAPDLYDGLSVALMETSPALRARQADTLTRHTDRIVWIDDIGAAPDGFTLFVANELFDAIATRQFVKTGSGFFERVVTLDDEGALTFGVSPARLDPAALPANWKTQADGTIFEPAPAREALMARIAERLKTGGGSALIIDYGHLNSGFGDTLQAVRKHVFDPPLAHPGEADLTSHVDFAALAAAAQHEGAHVHPMMMQGAFLAGLGLGPRASQLGRGKSFETQQQIVAAARRLAGEGADEMGNLFKVLCVSHRSLALIPFDAED